MAELLQSTLHTTLRKPLGLDEVRNINNQGGTILYTSRSERFLHTEYRKQAAENLKQNNIDAVVSAEVAIPAHRAI